MQMSASRARVAAVQLAVGPDMANNVMRAAELIRSAAAQGAVLCALPECFTGKYGVANFPKWAEAVPGEAGDAGDGGAAMMANLAARIGICLTGGVIEQDGPRLFNSMPIYGADGRRVDTYRKVHLSRVMGITCESDVLAAGSEPVAFDLPLDAASAAGAGVRGVQRHAPHQQQPQHVQMAARSRHH